MSLPLITAPSGTPVFLAAGHAIDEDSVFASVAVAQGHSRQRRRWTAQERTVSVSWLLKTGPEAVVDQLAAIDRWFDETLQAGSLEFAARVANQGLGPRLLWWRARWVDFQTELIPGGFGRVSGSLFLRGEGSVTGPLTGVMTSEIVVALVGIPGIVSTPTTMESEIAVGLVESRTHPMASEIVVALTKGESDGTLDPFYPTTLYSMRRRRASYGGPCVRVRNGSTNAETDIGFDSDGWCDAAALAAASGGSADVLVAVWYDQASGGVNAIQVTSASQPRIVASGTVITMAGKPAMDFSYGSGIRYLAVASNAAFGYGTGPFTWEIFARTANPVSGPSANNVLLNQRSGRSGADPGQFYVTSDGSTLLAWYYGSNISSPVSPSVDTNYHFALSYVGGSSSALRMFLAGSEVQNSPVTMNFTSSDELAIGSDNTGAWRGLIGEVAITKGSCEFTGSFSPRSYA